jgi:hypothetical protein
MALARARLGLVLGAVAVLAGGCYHFAFEQPPETPGAPAAPTVTYTERVPTYVNGFVGTGLVDTSRYCEHPVRTELRVTATDVLLSMATLLIYTPHTLSVTCPAPQTAVVKRL